MNNLVKPPCFHIFEGWGGGPSTPPSKPVLNGMNLSVFGVGNSEIKVTLNCDDSTSYIGTRDPNFPQIGRFKIFFDSPPSKLGWGGTISVEANGYRPVDQRVILIAGETEVPSITMEPEVVLQEIVRRGVTRLNNHSWLDDSGPYFPLGTTMFYALGAWHRGEQDRVKENLGFISDNHIDYIRILGQVDWKGEEIDPTWLTYRPELAELIDLAYDRFGLKTQITMFGGDFIDPEWAARAILDVVLQRREKVIMLEAVNESNQPEEMAVKVAKIFAGAGLPFGVGLGNKSIGTINDRGKEAGANVSFYHTERTNGDNGARQVRQCWNFKEFKGAPVNNEPPGPASSVAQFTDPFKLAAMRAGSLICGAGAFCFHTGAGVFGRAHTSSNGLLRQANLTEVPNFAEMANAVKAAELHIPAGVENWSKFNTGQPIKGASGQMNKLYGARDGSNFVEIAIGCETPTMGFRAEQAASLIVVNPSTGEIILEGTFTKGQTFEVSGLWSYVIVGNLL